MVKIMPIHSEASVTGQLDLTPKVILATALVTVKPMMKGLGGLNSLNVGNAVPHSCIFE